MTTSELNPPGSQHQILLLADSEKEKDNWLAILNQLHKILRNKRLPNKSVSTRLHCVNMKHFHSHFGVLVQKIML